jgi:uncharacterized membrane protein
MLRPMAQQVAAGTLAPPKLVAREIDSERPWHWLAAGWRDLRRAPGISMVYGACFTLAGWAIAWSLWRAELIYLLLPAAAGFALVAPALAVGFAEVSRRLERNEPIGLIEALFAWRRCEAAVAGIGLALLLLHLAWLRLATLLFALLFQAPAPIDELVPSLLFARDGLPLLAVGAVIGGVLALGSFAITVVAFPAALEHDLGPIEAMAVSVAAVQANPRVLAGWAALIAVFTGAGLVTGFVGLAVTLPLIGHASWHAYRDLIHTDGAAR